MLSLVIAEASLELVPKELARHPAVVASAKKLGKNPSEIILDNSWHFAAMKGIKNENKRGRPDLVHFSLLEATSIPLYFEDEIAIYVHTVDDKVISLGSDVRLPKSFHRFAGLVEKLFREGVIRADDRKLLELKEMDFVSLVEKINPARIIGLSSDGKPGTYADVVSRLHDDDDDVCLVVGGFQKGDFSGPVQDRLDESFSVESRSLESHVVLSRVLYEYEKTIFM